MSSVNATRVKGFEDCKNPGDFYITEPNAHEGGMRRLTFQCPCGCGDICGIRIRDDGQQDIYSWAWNRDHDKPTTKPSIRIGEDHWHGDLTNGVFKPC